MINLGKRVFYYVKKFRKTDTPLKNLLLITKPEKKTKKP
jgi:hypothetical protein